MGCVPRGAAVRCQPGESILKDQQCLQLSYSKGWHVCGRGATVSNTFFCCIRVRRHSSRRGVTNRRHSTCQFSHEYTGGTPTCISFTEGPLLGGLDLAINGKPHTPSLTFDGFSLGQTRRLEIDKQGYIGQLELSQMVAGV